MVEFPTSAEQLPNDEPNPDPAKFHRWPIIDLPTFLPVLNRLQTRSPIDVFNVLFERQRRAYFAGGRLVDDALKLAYIVHAALIHDLIELGGFTGRIQDFDMQVSKDGETPEKGQGVVIEGNFHWDNGYKVTKAYTIRPRSYEVRVSFPMMLAFKLNTIREYVIAKLLAGGDTEAQPVGVFNDPLLGKFAPDAKGIPMKDGAHWES